MAFSFTNLCYFLSVEEKASPNSPKSGSPADVFNWVDQIHRFVSKLLYPSLRSQFGSSGKNTADLLRREGLTAAENSDGEGELYREDVEMVMGRMGLRCDPRDGKLKERWGSDDFLNLFGEQEPTMDEVRGAFSVFDVNGDGFVDAAELLRVVSILGLNRGFGVEECRRMIKVYDEDDDGRIDFDEFVKLMERSFC